MSDHEHVFGIAYDVMEEFVWIGCVKDDCGFEIDTEQAEAMLNEHAKLKRENERLRERSDAYYNEMVIGVRKWVEAHPERDDVPDGDELIVWLLDALLADTKESD